MKPDFSAAAERCPVISRATAGSRERLMPHARLRDFARGDMLYSHDTPADRCHVLLSGWVKLFRVRPNGDEALIRIQKSGDTFGIEEAMRDEPYRHHACAVTPSRVLVLPARVLRETVAGDPEFAKVLLLHSFEVADGLHDHIESLKAHKAIERLAHFLRDHATRHEGRIMVTLPYDKTTVAAYLGMQPESLSRALSRLAQHGVRATKDQIEITDFDALDALIEQSTEGQD